MSPRRHELDLAILQRLIKNPHSSREWRAKAEAAKQRIIASGTLTDAERVAFKGAATARRVDTLSIPNMTAASVRLVNARRTRKGTVEHDIAFLGGCPCGRHTFNDTTLSFSELTAYGPVSAMRAAVPQACRAVLNPRVREAHLMVEPHLTVAR